MSLHTENLTIDSSDSKSSTTLTNDGYRLNIFEKFDIDGVSYSKNHKLLTKTEVNRLVDDKIHQLLNTHHLANTNYVNDTIDTVVDTINNDMSILKNELTNINITNAEVASISYVENIIDKLASKSYVNNKIKNEYANIIHQITDKLISKDYFNSTLDNFINKEHLDTILNPLFNRLIVNESTINLFHKGTDYETEIKDLKKTISNLTKRLEILESTSLNPIYICSDTTTDRVKFRSYIINNKTYLSIYMHDILSPVIDFNTIFFDVYGNTNSPSWKKIMTWCSC